MRISMKAEYGVRALLELAGSPEEALQSAEIARRQRIPGPFLDQVLMTLRRAGLVRSVRGPHGGHRLGRPAAEISLDEVIGCLEGAELRSAAGVVTASALSDVVAQADQAARRVFAAHSLADLKRMQRVEPPHYPGIFRPAPGRRRPARV
jgi:Rrf2 family protein